MSDLLGSILKNMTPPPSTQTKESIKRKRELKKVQDEERKRREEYIRDIESQVETFLVSKDTEYKFEPVDKQWRAIQHDVAETAKLFSMSCWGDNREKYVLIIKKEHLPDDEGIKRRKFGKYYQEDYGKPKKVAVTPPQDIPTREPIQPKRSYQDKYKKILEKTDDVTKEPKYWGLVPSHMTTDVPVSIEDSLSEIREKKRQKIDNEDASTSSKTARSIKFT